MPAEAAGLSAVDDDAAGRIVGRERHRDLVAEHDADAVLAQFAAQVCEHLVAILKLDTKVTGGQNFDHAALKLYVLFSSHAGSQRLLVRPTLVKSRIH